MKRRTGEKGETLESLTEKYDFFFQREKVREETFFKDKGKLMGNVGSSEGKMEGDGERD